MGFHWPCRFAVSHVLILIGSMFVSHGLRVVCFVHSMSASWRRGACLFRLLLLLVQLQQIKPVQLQQMVAAGEAEGPSEASLADPENEGEEEDEPWADDVEVVPEDEIPEESQNVD